MLMFFNFPAQRAYIAHTKDGFIPTRNSPSLLKCECVWEKHKSPVLVARNSHFFSDSATDALGFTHGPYTQRTCTCTNRATRELIYSNWENTQMQTLILILTAGCPSECEQVDLITGTYTNTSTHTNSLSFFPQLALSPLSAACPCSIPK